MAAAKRRIYSSGNSSGLGNSEEGSGDMKGYGPRSSFSNRRWVRENQPRILCVIVKKYRRSMFLAALVTLVGTLLHWNKPAEKSRGASIRGRRSSIRINRFPPSSEEIANINAALKGMSVDDLLRWAHEQFPEKLVQITSFGPSGLVLFHKLHKLGLLSVIPVITIDTLHLFPESYALVRNITDAYPDANVNVVRPLGFDDRGAFDAKYGVDLWKENPDKYAYFSKVEPTARALKELEATVWITGRRRSQGGERTKIDLLELDNFDDDAVRLKINPLAHWSLTDVWAYIRKNSIPYNPLHDKGYKSIGDVMTTIAVAPNAEERSGRFVGLSRTECGLHSHLEKIKKMREEAEQEDREFEVPTLPCDDCAEVDSSNFDSIVINGNKDLLLEFYSPYCGGCQEFAPTLALIAKKLKGVPDIDVVRFDITEHDIPPSGKAKGLKVEATPALYLIQRKPLFRATFYEGREHSKAILNWLEWKTAYIKVSELSSR